LQEKKLVALKNLHKDAVDIKKIPFKLEELGAPAVELSDTDKDNDNEHPFYTSLRKKQKSQED
jgi:hypothetical protein